MSSATDDSSVAPSLSHKSPSQPHLDTPPADTEPAPDVHVTQDAIDEQAATTITTTATAAAAATVQSFAGVFQDTVQDDIEALTKALTTPISQIEAQERAVAAVVAAVGASVAAGVGIEAEKTAQPESSSPPHPPSAPASAFNTNDVKTLPPPAQEDLARSQAARALQLIALSLSGTEPNPTEGNVETATPPVDTALASFEQALKGQVSGSVSVNDAATGAAISSPSQVSTSTKLEDETNAFAQAVLSAMQADANKSRSHVDPSSTTSLSQDNNLSTTDQSELHKVLLSATAASATGAGGSSVAATSSTTGSSQGFTFEVDEATGKTHIKWATTKWTTDAKEDVSSALEDANVIQQALQLFASTDFTGLTDLTSGSGGLLAPPLGQFPAQGSEFGTAQDPAVQDPSTAPSAPLAGTPPSARKKRKTGGSSKQNTAASIPEGSPAFPCKFPGCEKVFARLYNLKSHSRTHTHDRPFVCNNCQIAFSRNHDLRRHSKIHAGDKLFKCNGCGKSFSRLDALGRHRNNAKSRTGCQAGSETGAEAA